MKMRHK